MEFGDKYSVIICFLIPIESKDITDQRQSIITFDSVGLDNRQDVIGILDWSRIGPKFQLSQKDMIAHR